MNRTTHAFRRFLSSLQFYIHIPAATKPERSENVMVVAGKPFVESIKRELVGLSLLRVHIQNNNIPVGCIKAPHR
ncbi:hypothetical protein ACFL0M_05505 [Thermodesulfobacteriota bacterium]